MKTKLTFIGVLAAVLLSTATAQAQQSIDLNLGAFAPKSEDTRIDGDVLLANREYLLFDFDDFVGFFGEVGLTSELGRYFEGTVALGAYQRSVPTIYADHVNSNGSEIEQELKLRNIPLMAAVRIFPGGHRRGVQPYVGVGVTANFWRYSETGEFVDFDDMSIYRERYRDNGTAFGAVGMAGVRARLSPQMDAGLEVRYQWAEAELNADDFLADKLDLGGPSALFTLKFRF